MGFSPAAGDKSLEDVPSLHQPVLLQEVIAALGFNRMEENMTNHLYIDCTVGMGGHTKAILEACAPDGRVIGIDRNKEALQMTEMRLQKGDGRLTLKKGSFREMAEIIADFRAHQDSAKIMGVLFDFGLSSYQIDHSGHGFSYQRSEPLDMRMDASQKVTAADLVNGLSESELKNLIRQNSDERWASRIASRIIRFRTEEGAITRTTELEEIVWWATPKKHRYGAIHPATRTFQALRMAVNDEIAQIKTGLTTAVSLLAPGGRVVAISFHSLEDRCVKQLFKKCSQEKGDRSKKRFINLYKKPIKASPEEVLRNRRARSAKLRALERAA